MKLTREQRSELISEMASSEAGFNELFRVLLDSFSKQERALFLAEHAGEQANGFRPRRWRGYIYKVYKQHVLNISKFVLAEYDLLQKYDLLYTKHQARFLICEQ